MNNYLEEYQKIQDILIRNRARLEGNLQKAIDKYNEIEQSDIDKKEVRLRIAQNTIARRRYALSQVEDQIEFLRPANDKDMEYRLRQYNEFAKKMKDLVPDDLQLRFHGCPIYTAKHILESGELSSSVDRLGVATSYDTEGQVSVTTKDTLDITIHGYTHLSDNSYLPAGCVFVVLPKDEMDAKAGDSMLMGNVDFKSEPDRLYGIITTPENIERVSQWAKANGIDLSDKLYDFDSFAKTFDKEKGKSVDMKQAPSRRYVAQDDPEIKVSNNYINYTEFQRQDDGKAQTETRKNPLMNENKEIIGESEEVEVYDYGTGTTTRNRYETIEGEKGVYAVDTKVVTRGESYSVHSTTTVNNELSGSKEKSVYTRDESGNESYTYMENGQIGQRITKTNRGTTIDIYKNGQPYATYEYDENGKAIIPMGKMEQLPEDYVEFSYKVAIPEYMKIAHREPEEEQQPKEEKVSTQKLGKETLDIQQDTKKIDDVEQQMSEQMRENEQQIGNEATINEFGEIIRPAQAQSSFRESMKFDVSSNEYAQETLRKFRENLENGTLDQEEQKKKDSHKVEKGDDDYVM